MEKRKARTLAGLTLFVVLAGLFLLNQVGSTSEPTSIYSPGPRQPLTVPTHKRPPRAPRPTVTLTVPQRPSPSQRVPRRPTVTHHATREGTRPPVHHPKPPTQRPRPPTHHPTPPPSSPPPKDPGLLCRLLGICLGKLTGLGVWLHP